MKYCIFSDVHGNLDALNKMLQIERGNVDKFIFLGDIFGYFYEQSKCIKCLMEIENIILIKGNHDDLYIRSEKDYSMKGKLVETYGASYNTVLSDKQKKFIENMPTHAYLTDEDKKIYIFHGGPDDYLEQRVYPDTEINLGIDEGYILLGHTHYRFVRYSNKCILINPGSLGQPRDGNGFSYCILDSKSGSVEFKEVYPDMDKLLREVKRFDGDNKNGLYLKSKYEE